MDIFTLLSNVLFHPRGGKLTVWMRHFIKNKSRLPSINHCLRFSRVRATTGADESPPDATDQASGS